MHSRYRRALLALPVVAACVLCGAVSGAEERTAHWTFDDGSGVVARDSGGMNHDGEVVDATWVDGESGSALAFYDYAADYPPSPIKTFVRVGHSDALNPQSGFDISATIWIDPAFEPRFASTIVQKGGGYGCAYRLLLGKDFRVRAAAGNGHAVLEGETILPVGVWTVIRATYDGENLAIYVDGEQDGTRTVQVDSFANEDDILIGDRFSGNIDEVKVAIW